MKKFRFKLETVLRERKRIEEVKLKDWTLTRSILKKFEDEKNALEKRLMEAIKDTDVISALQAGSSGNFIAMDVFISGQKLRIEWKTQQIQKGMKIVERARLEYVAASTKRKALEKLKERKEQEYKALAHKAELKALDELYTLRWNLLESEELK